MGALLLYLTPTSTEVAPLVTAHGAAEKWECINDWPHNGDTDYVTTQSGGTGAWLVSSAAALDTNHPIQHVAILSTVKPPPTSDATLARSILLADYGGASRTIEAGGGYRTYRDVWTINPVTGLSWTLADLAGVTVGHTMTYTDPVPPRLTSLIVEVMCVHRFGGEPSSRSPKSSSVDLVNLGVSLSSLSPKASIASLAPSATAASQAPKAEES